MTSKEEEDKKKKRKKRTKSSSSSKEDEDDIPYEGRQSKIILDNILPAIMEDGVVEDEEEDTNVKTKEEGRTTTDRPSNTTTTKDDLDDDVAVNDDADDEGNNKKKRKRKRKRKITTDGNDDGGNNDQNDNDANSTSQQDNTRTAVEHTVYVEGIPFDATANQVRDFFETNGVRDVLELRLPTWQDSGRLRGYGHVRLGSHESYEKSLKLNGLYLNRRYLTIQPANAPGSGSTMGVNHSSCSFSQSSDSTPVPKDCRTLFVTNLPYTATEEDVATVFAPHGKIADNGVRIARNSVSRQSKGFAYIDFDTPTDVHKVIAVATKRGLNVGGRIVRLDYDTGRMKGSFRTDSGRLWTKESKERRR